MSWGVKFTGPGRPGTTVLAAVGFYLVAVAIGVALSSATLGFFAASDIGYYQLLAQRIAAGARPYFDFAVEYPPLAVAVILAAEIPGIPYPLAFAGLMLASAGACAVVVALAAARIWDDGRRLVACGAFALGCLAAGAILANRLDALVALVIGAAILLLVAGRHVAAAAVLGAGFALKLTPALLLPLVLLVTPRRGMALAAFAGAAAVPFLPYVGAPHLLGILGYHAGRPLQVESVLATPFVVGHVLGLTRLRIVDSHNSQAILGAGTAAAAALSGPLQAVALALAFGASWRRRRELAGDRLPLAALAVLLSFVAFGKVLSPQFLVWLLPAAALLVPSFPAIGILTIATVALTQVEFPGLYWQYVALEPLAVAVVATRILLLLGAWGLCLRALWRLGPDAHPGADDLTPRARTLAGAAGIAVAAFLAYLPALGAGFVFDDHALVAGNRALAGSLWASWTSTANPDYWPLTWTVLGIEHRLWGASPLGHHAVNVALHAGVAILLWRVLRKLRVPGAWLAGLLFAVHPVCVESVAWISELKNVLSGVLFLSAALAWLGYDETRRPGRLVLSTVLFALACLAKGSVVMLPVVLAGGVLLRRRRLDRRDLSALSPLLAVALLAGVANLWFQWHNALSQGFGPPRGALERLGGAGWAFLFYVRTAFLPIGLGFVHEPWPAGPGSPVFFLPSIGIVLGTGLLVALRDRAAWAGALLAGIGYQAVMLLPVLGLLDMAYFRVGPVSNHLQYLALMGPVSLVAAAATTAARSSRLALPVSAAAVLALGLATFQRSAEFHDDVRLWSAAARDAPGNAFARAQLGSLLWKQGAHEDARRELAAAVEVERDAPRRHVHRASWLLATGQVPEAAEEARAAIAASSDPEVRLDAAEILLRSGGSADALPVLRRLLAAAPGSPRYAYLYANALWREGRKAEAIEVLGAFCRDHPEDPEMRKSLAIALAGAGRMDEARAVAAVAAGVPVTDPLAAEMLGRWLDTPR
ncbi:MAG: tetratricopeptide repeat protein [Deltaproteobacteria bacterium]